MGVCFTVACFSDHWRFWCYVGLMALFHLMEFTCIAFGHPATVTAGGTFGSGW